MNKKTKTEFDICLSLVTCFSKLNEVFKENGLDIKLNVKSHIIPDNFSENHGKEPHLK